MQGQRIVVVLEPGYADYETERKILEPAGASLVPVGESEDAAARLRELSPSAIFVRERTVSADLMALCPDLRAIIRYGVGVDNVDLDEARQRRIYVANVPDYGAEHAVSDHAVALYLAVARRIVSRDAEVRCGEWGIGQNQPVPGSLGGVLGLIGFGRIARKALQKFRALGFGSCLVADPAVTADEAAAFDVRLADIDEICASADLISLHAPLTEETRHLIDERRIGLMKPTAILVNVARGGIMDESAVADALVAGRLFGAGIDVFEVEPPSTENPLFHAPNVVLSDHTAWYSEQTVRELQSKAAAEALRVLEGGAPIHWVNPW